MQAGELARVKNHVVMFRDPDDPEPLCDCGMHDAQTGPYYVSDLDTVTWALEDPTKQAWALEEPEIPEWRRGMSWALEEPETPATPVWRRGLPWAVVGTVVACAGAASFVVGGTLADAPPTVKEANTATEAPAPTEAAASVAAVSAPAPIPPPLPRVEPSDRWLLDTLTDDGFIVTDPVATVANVRRACAMLREGQSPRAVGREVAIAMNTTITAASVLVAEAQTLYADTCHSPGARW